MNRHTRALITSAAAVLAAHPLHAQTLDLARAQAVADSVARAQVASGTIPGMTLAIARNGEIVFTRGYGKADVEMGVHATPETVYGITSLSKQVTAALILRLADAGRLSLDDSITRHLPDYPAQGRLVTVRQLLNHTSGVSAMRGTGAVNEPNWVRRDLTYAEMIEMFGRQPFEYEPGAKHEYNNFAYYLAGEIIGRVTGTPYAEQVERELAPLGLARTMYCDARRVVPGRGESYTRQDGRFIHTPFVSMQILGGSGALCSTAGDLVRWTRLLFGGGLVSPASLAQMTAPTVLATGETVQYGLGVYLDSLAGHRRVYHGGTRPWGSFLSHYPEDGLTIVILTNASDEGREQAALMEEAIARAAFGAEAADLPLAAEDIARYAGTYTLRAGERTLEVRVFGENGQLMAQPAGQRVTRLLHQGSHAFVAREDAGIRFVFIVRDGRVEGVTLHQRGREFPGTRHP